MGGNIENFYLTGYIAPGANCSGYSLDISEFDRYLYYVCQRKDLLNVYVTIIRRSLDDMYGNEMPGARVTIGEINTSESRRYKDFEHWVMRFGFEEMFYKDIDEYNREERARSERVVNSTWSISPAYFPKSIK